MTYSVLRLDVGTPTLQSVLMADWSIAFNFIFWKFFFFLITIHYKPKKMEVLDIQLLQI